MTPRTPAVDDLDSGRRVMPEDATESTGRAGEVIAILRPNVDGLNGSRVVVACEGPPPRAAGGMRRLEPVRSTGSTSVAGFFSIATTNIALALLTFGGTMLCARFLGPSGRGDLATIQMWPMLLATVAMSGLPDALVYFCASNVKAAGRLLASAITLALLLSVCAVGIGYGLIPHLLASHSASVITAARIYLLLIPLTAVQGLCYHPLRALHKYATWNWLRILPAVGLPLAIGIAAAMGRRQAAFLAEMQLMFLAALTVPILAIAKREIHGPYLPSMKMWPSLAAFGAPSLLSSVSQVLNLRMDQMVMAALLPARDLGLYVAAVGWSNAVIPIVSALASLIFPKVASLTSRDSKMRALLLGTRTASMLAMLMAGALFVMTPWVFPLLFGRAYSPATPAAMVLAIAGGASAFNRVLEDGVRGLGLPRIPLEAEMAGLIVTCILLYLTIPPFGIMGAAVTSLIAYVITGAMLIARTADRLTVPSRQIWLPAAGDISGHLTRVRSYVRTCFE